MNPSDSRTHALYRFHNAAGQLLYVGITLNPSQRWAQHRDDKPWWHEVADITVETHPSRTAVLDAERHAIATERPLYNVVHNQGRHLASTRPNTAPARPAPRPKPALTADDMPDDCHDVCVPAGFSGIYLPFKWRDGIAWYSCVDFHRWTCHWGLPGSGRADENYGRAIERYDMRAFRASIGAAS